ncbi:MAG TPA: hypothetical protein DEQ28_02235 [Clostridiales bacterium]|nr:hypothetical protein [Clostridiales bacterium]
MDIVVIADFEAPFLERIGILLELNDGIGLPLEPLGYTREEFRRMREEGNVFLQEVLDTGLVLHGKIR